MADIALRAVYVLFIAHRVVLTICHHDTVATALLSYPPAQLNSQSGAKSDPLSATFVFLVCCISDVALPIVTAPCVSDGGLAIVP